MDITLERILSLIPRKPDGTFVHGGKKEFASRTGISNQNVIWDWETGRSESYKNYLWQIAAAYNVSVEWLRGETDDMRPVPAPEAESPRGLVAAMAAMMDAMTPGELLDVIDMAADRLRGK